MRSNKRNNKLSYFLTLLLCLCMLVGCGSGAATQVMLKAEDSETESYVETVQTESAENDPGDETEIQTAAETEIQAAAQVQSDDSKQKVHITPPKFFFIKFSDYHTISAPINQYF